jgi:hypothetical protein
MVGRREPFITFPNYKGRFVYRLTFTWPISRIPGQVEISGDVRERDFWGLGDISLDSITMSTP